MRALLAVRDAGNRVMNLFRPPVALSDASSAESYVAAGHAAAAQQPGNDALLCRCCCSSQPPDQANA